MAYQDGPDLLWVFILSVFLAFFMALGLGANDVANAFATSVGSKSLTLRQAVVIAGVMEFTGAVLMGGFVSKNIQKKIANVDCFDNDPSLLMVGMMSALFGTGTWLMVATALSLPVSTSHGIIGGIVGVVLVTKGADCVNGMGLVSVVLSWITSPVLAAICGMAIFGTIKILITRAKKPLKRGLIMFPFFVFFTAFVLSFFALYKGTPILQFYPFNLWQVLLICLAISTTFCLCAQCVAVPCLKRRISKQNPKPIEAVSSQAGSDDASEKTSEVARGVEDMPAPSAVTRSGSRLSRRSNLGYRSLSDMERAPAKPAEEESSNKAIVGAEEAKDRSILGRLRGWFGHGVVEDGSVSSQDNSSSTMDVPETKTIPAGGLLRTLSNLEKGSKATSEGSVPTTEQPPGKETMTVAGRIRHMIANPLHVLHETDKREQRASQGTEPEQAADEFENAMSDSKTTDASSKADTEEDLSKGDVDAKPTVPMTEKDIQRELAEKLFSRLLVVSAMLTSFAHGANDVSNSIGPLAAVWTIYRTNEPPESGATPVWMLAIGGLGIVVGLLLLGSRVIKTMGSKLTQMTFSKGFSIQLGAVIAVVTASRLGMPISSTHCQVGATVGVGALEGRMAVRWRVFLNIILSWVITIPFAAGLSAAFCAVMVLAIQE